MEVMMIEDNYDNKIFYWKKIVEISIWGSTDNSLLFDDSRVKETH